MDHRQVLDKAPVPILVHRNGTLLYFNEAALQLAIEMGLPTEPDAEPFKDMFSLLSPEERELAHQNYERIMATGKPQFNTTRTFVDPRGNRLVMLTSARPIDWEGEPALELSAVLLGPAAEFEDRLAPLEATEDDDSLAHMVRAPAQQRAAAFDLLTAREVDVAMLAAKGYTTENIALRLGIKSETVRTHLKKIYRKTGTHSRVELTRFVLGKS